MAQSTKIHPERTRPSARTQPQQLLESTPVLFRLPQIHVHSLPPVAESAPAAFLSASAAVPANQERRASSVSKDTETSAQSSLTRSWWEHWSSGVVLIFLIIALVTISILVFGSSSKPLDGSYTKTELEADFGDLDQIEVPSIELADHSQESTNPASQARQLVQAVENSNKPAIETSVPSVTVPPVVELTLSAADEQTSVASPTQGTPAEVKKDGAASSLLATAELMEPKATSPAAVNLPNLPAFPSLSESSGKPAGIASAGQVSAQAISRPEMAQLPAGLESSLPVQSTGLPSNISNSISGSSSTDQSLQAAALTSSMPNLGGGAPSLTPTFKPASVSSTNPGTAADNNLRSTAIPQSDEEAIIRAYIELTRQNSSTTGTTGQSMNRYQGSK